MEKDTFGKFVLPNESMSDIKGKKIGRNTGNTIYSPFWCNPKLIERERIAVVQKRLETVQRKEVRLRGKLAGTSQTDDLPIFATGKIFQSINFWLTKARERAKKCIFEHLGFLFTNWAGIGVQIYQTKSEFVSEKEVDDIGFDYESVQ